MPYEIVKTQIPAQYSTLRVNIPNCRFTVTDFQPMGLCKDVLSSPEEDGLGHGDKITVSVPMTPQRIE